MAKKVNEVLEEIAGHKNDKGVQLYNRFSKKNFNDLLLAMINDVDFKETVVKKTKSNACDLEDVLVTKEFRKWLKKVVEKLGVDSNDSKILLTDNFEIDNVNGLYEFFSAVLYEYMLAGNRFEIPAHEDFKGSITIKEVEEKTKTTNCRNPKDGSFLGTYETRQKKHKVLSVKSSCPSYLSEKRKIK